MSSAAYAHSPCLPPSSPHNAHILRPHLLPLFRTPLPFHRIQRFTHYYSKSSGRRSRQLLLSSSNLHLPVVRCKVESVQEADFPDKVLRSHLPVLVEFIAAWCGPCRLVAPAVEWASQEYEEKLKIVKIDHDSCPRLIEEYKVYGLPTLIIFRNGQEVPESRREGAITKVKLKAYLDAQLEAINAR